jgi:hypothetical protein
LGKYGDYISFREFEGKSSYIDVCCVAIICMPGCFWRARNCWNVELPWD